MEKEEVKIGKEVLEGEGGDSFKGGLLLQFNFARKTISSLHLVC